MRFDVITLFPELVNQVAQWGITERACRSGLYQLKTWNPRDFTHDAHHTVDDRPYGGGPGMVMKYQPLALALAKVLEPASERPHVIYMSPQGKPLTQKRVNELSSLSHIVVIAGRYEGIDERFIDTFVDEEVSVGDYVLSGGELPAMTMIDAIVRQLPGALGHSESAQQDSFMHGLLDCPHYTRPVEVDGQQVPAVLQSGNHAGIARWRRDQALTKTALRRPDMLDGLEFDKKDLQVLASVRTSVGD